MMAYSTNNRTFLVVSAIGYFVLGLIGISVAIAPGYASPIFPAAGFAVACLLWSDRKAWPAVLAGSFALNVVIALMHQDVGVRASLTAAGIAVGSTLQALAAAWLVARSVGDGWRRMENVSEVARILGLAGPLACVISATNGVTILLGAGAITGAEYVHSWRNWWSGDALGVLVMLPLSLTFLLRKESPWRERMTRLVIPMVITLALVGGAFLAVAQWERSQQRLEVEKYGESLARLIEQRIVAHQEAIAALSRLVEVTPDMTYDQFNHFTRITLKDNPDIFALSINPYVTREQRQSFERQMVALSGMPGFEITERNSEKALVRAADRPDYVSVGFIAPLEGNRLAIGFDINSEPIRREAIQRARLSGRAAVTAPIRLVQENRDRAGVLFLDPAYVPASASDTANGKVRLMGFTVGVIKVDEMVEIATRSARVSGLVFTVDDAIAQLTQSGPSPLYRSDTTAGSSDAYYEWQQQFSMADRTWTIHVYPTTSFLRQGQYWMSLAVAAVGLMLSALLQILLLVVTGNTAVIQRTVNERTAELRLIQSELERAQAVSRVGSWNCHVAEKRIEWSAEMYRLCGVEHSQPVDYPFVLAMVHPEDASTFAETWQALLQGECCDYTHRIIVDGQTRWLRQRAEVTFDTDGQPLIAVGTAQDITVEKMAEIALENHRQFLRTVIDESPDFIMMKDWHGRYLLGNRALAASYGTTCNNLIGKKSDDFDHDRNRAAADLDNIQSVMRSGETEFVNETYTNAQTGEVRYFLSIKKPLKDPNGEPRILIISHDITDLQHANQALLENERRYAYAMDAAGDGIWDWDLRSNVVIHNARWFEILGLDASNLQSTFENFAHVLHEDDLPAVKAAIEKALRGEGDYRHEHRMCRGDGQVIWVSDRGRVVERDGEGNPLRMVGSMKDISMRKQYEAELIEAKIAAEAATVAKSRFLATMSHEIRTPMNGILGMAQMMLMPNLQESDRLDYARVIISSGQTLLALLNDILDLSKVEAGKLRLEAVIFEADQVMHESRLLFGEAAERKGITIESTWTGRVRQRYLGDQHRIRQILSNLIGNAVKFTSAGRIDVSGCELSRNETTALLEFSVSDTGMGISKEAQRRLFHPFSQADSSTTRQFGGSGLGLSIVRSLANLMGGMVGVESEEGKGSRFWVRIRVDLPVQDTDSRMTPRLKLDSNGLSVATSSSTAQVLVADDNIMNRKVMELFLARLGLSAIFVEDGALAVDAIKRGLPVDLIIMDLQMPNMDGYAATQEIREWEARNDVPPRPIIAVSADAFDIDRQRCLESGMSDFLAKPVAIEQLEKALLRWLP